MKEKINRGDIRQCLDQRAYNRGKDYFERHRVLRVSIEQEDDISVELSGEVKGGGARVYQQEIFISRADDTVNIRGYCSCPVSFQCKHVAAICLHYATYLQKGKGANTQPQDSCLSWLDSLHETQAGSISQAPPAAGSQLLVYQLSSTRATGKMAVSFYATRVLKKGGLGKGRTISLHNFDSSYHSPAYAQPVDLEIGKILSAMHRSSWDASLILNGELGFLALTKMIQTGRCVWQDYRNNPPLTFGTPRELQHQWMDDGDKGTHLHIGLEPEAHLLLTEPPLYLDPQASVVGPLTNPALSAGLLEKLLNAPPVPPNMVTEFSQRMAEILPPEVLPPPQTVEIRTIENCPAVPHLHLSARERDGHLFHLIRLRFGYEDCVIPFLPEHPVRTLTQANQRLKIERELDREYDAIERLESLGFEGLADDNEEDIIFLSFVDNDPMESPARWHHFLTDVLPTLEAEGWQVERDTSFNIAFHQASDWHAHITETPGNDWFSLHFDVEIDDQPLALMPLVSQVLEHYEPDNLPDTLTLDLGNAQYLNIASEQIKPVLDTLYELYDSESLQEDGSLHLARYDAARLDALESTTNLQWRGGEALRQLGKKLNDFQGIQAVTPPQGLTAQLRSYQQQGLDWLQFLREYQFGGVLADDMGLGKTVQTLAHLLLEKEQGRMDKPCLIVAPTSLMSNWRREAEQFAPDLNVLTLQGPDRHGRFDDIAAHDVILSTYPLLSRDEEQLLAHDYHCVVLDEAQVIKNPRAKAAQVVRKLNASQRLCLTGTPMENHLGELWSLFDFLMPGFLGDTRQFTTLFRTPIEKHGDQERNRQLSQRVAPFMLRRTKDEVATELPEKTEIICNVVFDKKQAALYESIRLSMEEKVRKSIAAKGLARSHIIVLDALLKLRQVCCDPRLLSLTQARAVKESAKLELLMQMLPEMVAEGRRILLFSQFTKMLGHIETELKKEKISYTKLTGQTRKRDDAIEQFKNGSARVFLISLKAGGVGLNLTEADTVIHYDPWWNPAAENQATDRAHRIGQDKAVFVYKLVTENSVEEKIVAMQAKKQALAQGVYRQSKGEEEFKLTTEDMQQLFAPLEQ